MTAKLAHTRPLFRFFLMVLPVALLAGMLSGCSGGDGLGRVAVSGSVTLDGKPLPSGAIRFEPLDPKTGVVAGAVISAGDYSIDRRAGLPPGKYRVSITSAAAASSEPSMDSDGAAPLPEETVPSRYNSQTALEVEVKAGGPARFDFPLATTGD